MFYGMIYSQKIDISFDPSGIPVQISASQYDTGREVVFSFADLASDVYVSEELCSAEFTKPDGLGILLPLENVTRTSATLALTDQLLAVAGKVRGKLKIYDLEGKVVRSRAIDINVDRAGTDEDTVFSDSDISAVATAADKAAESAAEAMDSRDRARDAAEEARMLTKEASDHASRAQDYAIQAESAADTAIETLEGKLRKIYYSGTELSGSTVVANVTCYSELGRKFIEIIETPDKAAESLTFDKSYGALYYRNPQNSKTFNFSTYLAKIDAGSIKTVLNTELQAICANGLVNTTVTSFTVSGSAVTVNSWVYHAGDGTRSVKCLWKILVEVE